MEPNPEAARARFEVGLEHLGRGEIAAAYRELRACVDLWPDNARARVWAGVVARRLGRTSDADALISRGVSELERISGKRARAAPRPSWSSTLAWSADLRRVATLSFEEVAVLDRMVSFPHVVVPGVAAALSPDGRRLVTKAADHDLYVWDLESGRTVGHYSGEPPTRGDPLSHPSSLDWDLELVWSDDGARIASIEGDSVAVIDVATGRTQKLPGSAGGLEFSPASACLASVGLGWETQSFSPIWRRRASGDPLESGEFGGALAVASNCNRVAFQAAGSPDFRVVVSVPGSLEAKRSLSLPEPATAFSFNADASQLAIACIRSNCARTNS